VFKEYWDLVSRTPDRDENPYRAGCFQFIAIADSDADAERLYAKDALEFFNNFAHVYEAFRDSPGYMTKRARSLHIASMARLSALVASGSAALPGSADERKWSDLLKAGVVIAGSPDSVAEQLIEMTREFRFGHLLVGCQIVPDTELVKQSITLFAEKVLPRLRPVWEDEGWDDPWWPSGAKVPRLLTDDLTAVAT
jgi:alkanesulfonate monooxygenase SsuD/methylene tetrahydromethanopterin reductase-like flavin-dependent oxidoreductase (luciferase family)